MKLRGLHAVVTGAGTGIGAAIARRLAADEAILTLIGRRPQRLESVAADIPGAVVAPADVTVRSELESALSRGREAHGPIAILVNNAGAAESAAFAKTTGAAWQRMMSVNLDAVFHCCQLSLPDLLQAPAGRIVTIASTAGLTGYAYTAPYVAAKHGAVGLMRALAAEFAESGLTANAVCPGFTDTPLVEDAINTIRERTGRSDCEARAQLAQFNPQGRLVTPEEVASAVGWLCLPESGSINGQAIRIAGGELM